MDHLAGKCRLENVLGMYSLISSRLAYLLLKTLHLCSPLPSLSAERPPLLLDPVQTDAKELVGDVQLFANGQCPHLASPAWMNVLTP
jgi:hypothetical protein